MRAVLRIVYVTVARSFDGRLLANLGREFLSDAKETAPSARARRKKFAGRIPRDESRGSIPLNRVIRRVRPH